MVKSKTEKVKPNILLVEGDRFMSKVISNKLIRDNFNVSLANDGQEAINKIKTEDFDLVLLDLILRKKDGFDVLTEVKRTKTIKVPIVVLLNLSKNSDIAKIKKLGVKDYIVKSDLSIDVLANKIKDILK